MTLTRCATTPRPSGAASSQQLACGRRGALRQADRARAPGSGGRTARATRPRVPRAARGSHHRRLDRARCGRSEGAGRLVAIVVDERTRLIVKDLTRLGRLHGTRNQHYGSHGRQGVTPGRAVRTVEGIFVFDTVADVIAQPVAATIRSRRLASVPSTRPSTPASAPSPSPRSRRGPDPGCAHIGPRRVAQSASAGALARRAGVGDHPAGSSRGP